MQVRAINPTNSTSGPRLADAKAARGFARPRAHAWALTRSQTRLISLLLLAAQSNGVPASDALPELMVTDHVEHYAVTGNTAGSIRRQLESRSGDGEKPRHGSTRSAFEVVTKLEEMNGVCLVLHQEILVEITMELPFLEPRRRPSIALQTQWDEAVDRLYRHEEGHRQNVLRAATALRERLAALQPQEHCVATQANMDIELENTLIRLDRHEAYYDRLTRDGMRDLLETGSRLQAVNVSGKDGRSENRYPSSRRKLPAE